MLACWCSVTHDSKPRGGRGSDAAGIGTGGADDAVVYMSLNDVKSCAFDFNGFVENKKRAELHFPYVFLRWLAQLVRSFGRLCLDNPPLLIDGEFDRNLAAGSSREMCEFLMYQVFLHQDARRHRHNPAQRARTTCGRQEQRFVKLRQGFDLCKAYFQKRLAAMRNLDVVRKMALFKLKYIVINGFVP